MPEIYRVEFHCHTIYSKDSLTTPARLVETCRMKGIDRVVVTDHNTIRGAMKAREVDPARVIIGEEIMTAEGEILAAFMTEEIPPGLPAEETIDRLRAQGAFISVSHPFDTTRSGHWSVQALERIAPLVDAVEVFNARCFPPVFNRRARDFALGHGLPGTVGSDAHAPFELGRATLVLPEFEDAESFRAALPRAREDVRASSPLVRLVSRYAVLYKRLALKNPKRDT